jgi:hypothetical protein
MYLMRLSSAIFGVLRSRSEVFLSIVHNLTMKNHSTLRQHVTTQSQSPSITLHQSSVRTRPPFGCPEANGSESITMSHRAERDINGRAKARRRDEEAWRSLRENKEDELLGQMEGKSVEP